MPEKTYEELTQRLRALEKENANLQGIVRDYADGKLDGEAKQEDVERYRDFFDKALVGIIHTRLSDGFIIEANSKAAEMIGLPVEEVVGKVRLKEYHKDPDQRKQLLEKLQQDGEVHDYEIDLILHNGRNVILSVSVKVYPQEGYIEGVMFDATTRKKAEEELKYRSIIEKSISRASSLMVSSDKVDYNVILGIVGDVIAVNRAYIFRVSNNGSKLKNTYEWCSPGTIPQIQNLQELDTETFKWWIGQLQNRKSIVLKSIDDLPPESVAEHEILAARNIKSVISVPILSKGKSLWGFMGFDDTVKTREWQEAEIEALQIVGDMISSDLDRRSIEEDLEFERRQLLSVFDSLAEQIYISDPYTYEILYVNQALNEYFGRDVVGRTCYKEFQKLDAPCKFCTNQIILKRKPEPYRWEIFKPKLGRTFSLVDRIIKWPDGRDVRLEFSSDITDQKKLEEQIQQTQKMEALGALVGGIAHDFNNILSGIFGYTQLLQMRVDKDGKMSKYVDAIYQAGIRAKDLVQQILAFSRQKSQESMPMRVQDVVDEALQLIQSTLPSTISISSDVQADCGLVMGDQTQVHQIVMNLCTNAYHALEEKGGQLTVILKELEMVAEDLRNPAMVPGPYACLSVTDTGMGIEQHIMDRIFDPYFTTKKKEKGTGIGLAVTHGIIKGHGGQIDVFTKPGKGTEFRVLLPVIADNTYASRAAVPKNLLKGNEHVLLVDDQREVLEIERQMIQELGYRVTTRTSSLEALERFRASPDQFDIVITDMTMPSMTGDQFALEAIKIRDDIPILLCTGFSEQMSKAKAESIGFKGFLMKPIIMKDLSEMIRKALDGKRETNIEKQN